MVHINDEWKKLEKFSKTKIGNDLIQKQKIK